MDLIELSPLLRLVLAAGAVILVTLFVRWLLFHFIPPLLARHSPLWEDILAQRPVIRYLSLSVPGFVAAFITLIGTPVNQSIANLVYKGGIGFSLAMIMMAMISALYAYNDFYDQHYDFARQVPIKTVIQTAAAIIVIMFILLILAILLGVPLVALAGVVAAIGAIAYYLFRQPLLGFSASLQLSMNHMLGLGDWIEVSQYGADGIVEDINLTSTKIRNWDNTIINVPTADLVSYPFVNWEPMKEKKARRLDLPIYIDQTSITFVSGDALTEMLQIVEERYNGLPKEIRETDSVEHVKPTNIKARQEWTNLELFIAYATIYMAGHPLTRKDYAVYLRQDDPSPQGLPIATYIYTSSTDFMSYYNLQHEIIGHLLAALPQFGLKPFQLLSSTP
jgi:miniconductance mechanosensitive channel